MIADSKKSGDEGDRAESGNLRAPQRRPRLEELTGSGKSRTGGQVGGVQGTHRGPDEQIGFDAVFHEGGDGSGLHGAEVSTTGKSERSHPLLGRHRAPTSALKAPPSVHSTICMIQAGVRLHQSPIQLGSASWRASAT